MPSFCSFATWTAATSPLKLRHQKRREASCSGTFTGCAYLSCARAAVPISSAIAELDERRAKDDLICASRHLDGPFGLPAASAPALKCHLAKLREPNA